MFGSGITVRNWSSEAKSNGTPTHVNLYDAQKIKAGPSEMDPKGMILVGLMSGGDYTPQGIPGCGPKIACEAARAGFGAELCGIARGDRAAIRAWRDKLAHELKTNENKHFRQKHKALNIPENFPSLEVLGYYTHPAVSDERAVERLKDSIKWDLDIDLPALRAFTADAFDWTKIQGAKHFIRNLAPAMLIKQLRLIAKDFQSESQSVEDTQVRESKLVHQIYGMRSHASTDNSIELRLGFVSLELVPINLDEEEPDDECGPQEVERSEDIQIEDDVDDGRTEAVSKKRTPTNYDPSKVDRVWVLDTFVKVGVPLMAEDWEASMRAKERSKQAKAAKSSADKSSRLLTSPKSKKSGGMPQGALHRFTKVVKPNNKRTGPLARSQSLQVEEIDLSYPTQMLGSSLESACLPSQAPTQAQLFESTTETIDLCSSPAPRSFQKSRPLQALSQLPLDGIQPLNLVANDAPAKKRSPFRRSISTPESRLTENVDAFVPHTQAPSPPSVASQTVEDECLMNALRMPSSLLQRLSEPSDTMLRPQGNTHVNEYPDPYPGTFDPGTPSRGASSRKISSAVPLSSPSSASPGKQRNITNFFSSTQPSHVAHEARKKESCQFRVPPASQYSARGSSSSSQRAVLEDTSGNSRCERRFNQKISAISSSLDKSAQRQKGKRTLELRESLDGTWKISKTGGIEVHNSQCKKRSNIQISSKGILGDFEKRSWRLSEVETLDLTGD